MVLVGPSESQLVDNGCYGFVLTFAKWIHLLARMKCVITSVISLAK